MALKHLKKIDLILFGRLSFKNPSGYTRLSNSTHIAHITPSIFADFPSSHLNTGLSRIYAERAPEMLISAPAPYFQTEKQLLS